MTSQGFPTGRATQPVLTRQEAAYTQARDRQDETRQRLEQSEYGRLAHREHRPDRKAPMKLAVRLRTPAGTRHFPRLVVGEWHLLKTNRGDWRVGRNRKGAWWVLADRRHLLSVLIAAWQRRDHYPHDLYR
jgi:hypothetical protein